MQYFLPTEIMWAYLWNLSYLRFLKYSLNFGSIAILDLLRAEIWNVILYCSNSSSNSLRRLKCGYVNLHESFVHIKTKIKISVHFSPLYLFWKFEQITISRWIKGKQKCSFAELCEDSVDKFWQIYRYARRNGNIYTLRSWRFGIWLRMIWNPDMKFLLPAPLLHESGTL